MSQVAVTTTTATVSVSTTENGVSVQAAAQPTLVNVTAVGPQGPAGGLRATVLTTAASVTPNADTDDLVSIDALATALNVTNPSGTAVNGQRLLIRILDNGTPRALSWGAVYANGGNALPSTTTAGKRMHLGFMYDSFQTKWFLVAQAIQA